MKVQKVLLTEEAVEGDRVSIRSGPYSGQKGTVAAVQDHEGSKIFRIEVDNSGGAGTLLDVGDFVRTK